MSDKQVCVVCGVSISKAEAEQHLIVEHRAPRGGFLFWFETVEFFTDKPSMSVAELLTLVGQPLDGVRQLFEERESKRVYFSYAEAVDLTREPRFFIYLPDVWDEALDDLASGIMEALETGDGQHTEALDRSLIKAQVRAFLQHGCKEYIAHLTAKLEAAESSRVALRQALQALTNGVNGCLGIAEEEIRYGVGNSNLASLKLRVSEAEALLAHEPAETT